MLRLSVLDQSTIVTGRAPDASIRESLALARHCEALGYHRYWCAEHHASDSQAGTAPEILISAIAATTTRIRVGSAGVMLPHYSSLKVAEQFRVLEAIAPGRIDLGLGRAPGSDGRTAYRAQPARRHRGGPVSRPRCATCWPGSPARPLVEGHPFRDIRAQPAGPTVPEVWMLGSSDYGAQVAAYFGLPFCFAHFITDGRGADQALAIYREGYRPSARHPAPYAALCVWAMAAQTQEEAARLFTSREMWRLSRDRGRVHARCPRPRKPPPTPTPTANASASNGCGRGRSTARRMWWAQKLRDLAAALDVAEIAMLTTLHDPEARRRSYTLLAEACGLRGGDA